MAAVGRLTQRISYEKASGLATEAIALAKSGQLDVSQPDQSHPRRSTDTVGSKPHQS